MNQASASKKEDINYVDKLNHEAFEIRVTDFNQAFQLSQQAITISETIGYSKGLAEGLRTLSFCHIRLSEHDKALLLIEKALALFIELSHLQGQSQGYAYVGVIKRSLGDYAASLDNLFKSLDLTKQLSYREGESLTLYHLGITFKYLGDYTKALDYLLQSLSLSRAIKDWIAESYVLNNLGMIYFETGEFANALEYYDQSLTMRQSMGDQWGEAGCLDNIGHTHLKLGNYTQALESCGRSLEITGAIGDKKGQANSLMHLGEGYSLLKDYAQSLACYQQSLQIRRDINDKKGQAEILLRLGQLYGQSDFPAADEQVSLDMLQQALQLGSEVKAKDILAKIYWELYQTLKRISRYPEALWHLEHSLAVEKELHTQAVSQQILNLQITHRVEQAKKEAEIYRLRNVELAELYQESKQQKEELQKTLEHLKATQFQLIQKEKMASLGELTAGIAHEIQNPLNFVNNFSEVSQELMMELREEVAAGHQPAVLALAEDVMQNLSKIHHHGKRVGSIVKGMLQHSRTTSGEKQPTDLNALAEEYLRLSYHGWRAKNKDFNASLVTDFDTSLGKVEVVPQELGRVLLNLFNNAFYVTQQKKSMLNGHYEPQVQVSTRKVGANVEIRVKDNGTGIAEKIKRKIFQPFFTTKPTGQGTGLGLSLSYDIITKEHGGELEVETQEGEGTEFIVVLPILR